MTTAILRPSGRLLGAALFLLSSSPLNVWADSIVLRNRSGAGGRVAISDGVEVFAESDFRSPAAPATGDFTFGDTATASALGASGTVAADITTSITPSRFTAQGSLNSVASRGDLFVAGLSGNTVSQIDFVLSEAHAFTYSGRFFLERTGSDAEVTPILSAALDLVGGSAFNVFRDTLANFSGLLVPPGTHLIEHTGIIGPGNYVLSAALASVFQSTSTTFPNTGSQLAFDVAFSLDPVPAPTPEPATVMLFGIGIAGVIGREWKRTKNRAYRE